MSEGPARARLARLAERLVSESGGLALTAGRAGVWATRVSGESVPGVQVAAGADGRYELELHLIVDWPPSPLHELGDELRSRLTAAAAQAGLADQLGEIQIHFEGVQDANDDAEAVSA